MRGIPNAITLLRLLLTPVIATLLAERYYVAGFVIYVFAALSDGLDGYLARRFNVTSRVGALLDPVADKLIVICASFALAWQGLLPLWVAIPLIARDALMLGVGVTDPRLQNGWLPPNPAGKLHAALAFLTIIATIAQAAGLFDAQWLLMVLYAVLLASLAISSGLYFAAWRRFRARAART